MKKINLKEFPDFINDYWYAADFPIQANGPGGKQRGCLDGLLKGHAEGNQVFDFLVQVGDGARCV